MARRTREEKYPDTDTFFFYNCNPKNKYTTDCVIRAISLVTQLPYEQVLIDLARMQVETGYDMSEEKCYGKYLSGKGFVKQRQPRKWDNTKYTGKEWCKHISKTLEFMNCKSDRMIAHIGGHHIVALLRMGDCWKVVDTWDSTWGCIGNYWVKC